MSLERYPGDASRVLVKIVGFGNESRISDRLFCRIDDLVETLLSRLVYVPIKVSVVSRPATVDTVSLFTTK